MTTTPPFDPLSGIITAVCLLFFAGVFVGCIAGWMAHWWNARTQPDSTTGAAYDADEHVEAWIDALEQEINAR